MNKDDELRLMQLIEEVSKILSSSNPSSYNEVLKDIIRELGGIINRMDK